MAKIIWSLRPVVSDKETLRRDWDTAGDVPAVYKGGMLVYGGRKASSSEREAVRIDAEKNLGIMHEGRRRVLTELNVKAQNFSAIQGACATIFGSGIVAIYVSAPQLVLAMVCLGIGMTLSIVSMCMLLWMAVTGNQKAWTRPLQDVGRLALRQTRFDKYASKTDNCNDVSYVVEKRRRLIFVVALVAILGNVVGFGWAVFLVAYLL